MRAGLSILAAGIEEEEERGLSFILGGSAEGTGVLNGGREAEWCTASATAEGKSGGSLCDR